MEIGDNMNLEGELIRIYFYTEGTKGYKNLFPLIIKRNIEFFKKMPIHWRINLKSAYHLTDSTSGRFTPNLFHILHLINMEFCLQPYDL